jgi:hypothetical protein
LPGGAGVAELGFLGLLGALLAPSLRLPALVLWRGLTWLLPMALGAFLLGWRAAGAARPEPAAPPAHADGLAAAASAGEVVAEGPSELSERRGARLSSSAAVLRRGAAPRSHAQPVGPKAGAGLAGKPSRREDRCA